MATVPLGWVSDKYGRKVVMGVNLGGAVLVMLWYVCLGMYRSFHHGSLDILISKCCSFEKC